ncbi:hypothetical protein [Paenibacillus sp. BIC5C1]|uniref:hypothetical protein n=1 Tax=Paenibacillus sp. BIC5C1 TaxID=3078263 RepID=UPI0028E4A4A3|nr:hypothetical protein [Paenibacillus sp. BIC5C1]
MRNKARSAVLSLALAATLAIPVVVSADSVQLNPADETTPPIVTPFAIGNTQPLTTVSSASSTAPASFSVPAGYGHGKFYFLNNGTSNLTVTMQHSSGLEYIAATVKPGAAYTWRSTADYPQGMRGGDYKISFHCSNGVNVKWSAFASNSATEANG